MTTLGVGEPSAYELRNIWAEIEELGQLSFSNLYTAVKTHMDGKTRDAVITRLDLLRQTELFVDSESAATTLEAKLEKIAHGGAITIKLKMKNKNTMDLVVQAVLRKLQEPLELGLDHIFIFAEEAHLYVRETNWADAVP